MPIYLAGSIGMLDVENSSVTINDVNVVGDIEQFTQKAVEKMGSGIGYISGVVLDGAAPVSVWVYLFDELSGRLVDTVQSSSIDGAYTFTGINRARKHIVVAAAPNGSSYNHLLFAKVSPA